MPGTSRTLRTSVYLVCLAAALVAVGCASSPPSAPKEEAEDVVVTEEMGELVDSALRQDGEYVEATQRTPVHPWQKERVENISQETIEDTIANLANFDDLSLAGSSVSSLAPADTSAAYIGIVVTRLARVRRLLEEGRRDREQVVRPLRHAFRESLAGWPAAYRERYAVAAATGGLIRLSEPDMYEKLQWRSVAATYVLAELGDVEALPLMAESFKLQDQTESQYSPPVPLLRSPVPCGLTLYAMHRLVWGMGDDELTPEARRLRQEYLEAATKVLPPPEENRVTRWNAQYDESDPRLQVLDPAGRVAEREPAMILPVYPDRFTDGTSTSDANGTVSDRANELFAQLERFVAAAFPSSGSP